MKSTYEPLFVKGKKKAIAMEASLGRPLSFSYPLLKANEFRLVFLLPGEGDEPIECYVQTYTLDDCPRYEAISYTWRNPETTRTIF